MKKMLFLALILIVTACSPRNPITIEDPHDLNLTDMVFTRVDYLSSPDQWKSRALLISESVNIIRTLTLKPLRYVELDIELTPWLVFYTEDNMFIVARTLDHLYVKDDGGEQWYISDNTAFETLFGWIYPDFRFVLDRFETLLVKGAVSDEYKSLLLNDDYNTVVSTLLNESMWTPHVQRFDQSLWYDAIITMMNGETLYLLDHELGTLMWVVSSDGSAHGYVLEGYVYSRLISELTPYFLMQYFRDPLLEAELVPDDYGDDGIFVTLDETISQILLENTRMDEWFIAVDIPAVGLMVDVILYDEIFAYVFAPFNEFDLVMVRHTLLQTNDFYFAPQGLGQQLRELIETYFEMEPLTP